MLKFSLLVATLFAPTIAESACVVPASVCPAGKSQIGKFTSPSGAGWGTGTFAVCLAGTGKLTALECGAAYNPNADHRCDDYKGKSTITKFNNVDYCVYNRTDSTYYNALPITTVAPPPSGPCPQGFAQSSDVITGTVKKPLPAILVPDPFNPKGVTTYFNCGAKAEPGLDFAYTQTNPPVFTIKALPSRFATCNKVKATARGCVGNTPLTNTKACSLSVDWTCIEAATPTPTAAPSPTAAVVVATATGIAPFGLSYPKPSGPGVDSYGRYDIGTQIKDLPPTLTRGTATKYSVGPPLPEGLSINAITGIISGTPTKVTGRGGYTVKAENKFGFATYLLSLEVTAIPTYWPSYQPNWMMLFIGQKIKDLIPALPLPKNVPVSFSVDRNLPSGLSINAATGVISGTPTTVTPMQNWTAKVNYGLKSTPQTLTIGVCKGCRLSNGALQCCDAIPPPTPSPTPKSTPTPDSRTGVCELVIDGKVAKSVKVPYKGLADCISYLGSPAGTAIQKIPDLCIDPDLPQLRTNPAGSTHETLIRAANGQTQRMGGRWSLCCWKKDLRPNCNYSSSPRSSGTW